MLLPGLVGIVAALSSEDSSVAGERFSVDTFSACIHEDRRQRTATTTTMMRAHAPIDTPMIIAGLTETEAPASLVEVESGAVVDETNERGHPLEMQPVCMYVCMYVWTSVWEGMRKISHV